MESLPVVNGKKYCAYRDTDYDFLQIKKPVKQDTGKWACNHTSYSHLCGSQDLPGNQLYCIPSTSKCPITSVRMSNGTLLTSTDPSLNSPLLDLILSEGGPPCVDHKTTYNSFPGKQKFKLFEDAYFDGCPEIKIANKTYRTSKLFTPVEGAPEVSEYSLLRENEKKKSVLDENKVWDQVIELPGYDESKMKEYTYNLYAKNYQVLNDKCTITMEDGSVTTMDLNPLVLDTIAQDSNHMVYWITFLHSFLGLVLVSQILELVLIGMHMDQGDKKIFDQLIFLRHVFSIVSIAVCFICYFGIYAWNGNFMVRALTHESCTRDEILRGTFTEMLAYLDNARDQTRRGTLQLLLFIIAICNVSAMLYKKRVLDKTCQDHRQSELARPFLVDSSLPGRQY